MQVLLSFLLSKRSACFAPCYGPGTPRILLHRFCMYKGCDTKWPRKNMKSHMFLWAMGKCGEPLWSSSGWLQVGLLWWHGDRRYFSPIHHSMEQKIKESQNWKTTPRYLWGTLNLKVFLSIQSVNAAWKPQNFTGFWCAYGIFVCSM